MSTVTGYPPPPGQHNEPAGGFYLNQMAPPQPPKKGLPTAALVGIIVGAFVLLLCVGGAIAAAVQQNSPRSNTAVDTDQTPPQAATPASPATTQPATSAPPATTAPPPGPLASFGDGTYEVGTNAGMVPPGKYRTTVPTDSFGCYWERLKGLSGQFDDIITNDIAQAGTPVIVTIASSDKGFKSTGCGTWTKA
jgi:hypothetical protein